MRKRHDTDDGRVEQALERLWESVPGPSEHELRHAARAAAATDRPIEPIRRRRLLGLRPAVALGLAATLLAGSGLGFGLGASLTPSGSAQPVAGLGFLPAQGWTVIQSRTATPALGARSIAANVAISPADGLSGEPSATLASLPPHGVVIVATIFSRGDGVRDLDYPVLPLPLRFAAAQPVFGTTGRLLQYRVRAGVGGYNVDASVYFGSSPPSSAMVRSAQRQLSRLVVAGERVTLVVRPTVASPRDPPVSVYGAISDVKPGQQVSIEARDCGQSTFRAVASARTEQGGGWNIRYAPAVGTVLRAVWGDAVSAPVTIRSHVDIRIEPDMNRSNGYEVAVLGRTRFEDRKVIIQQRDPRLRSWRDVRTITLTDSNSPPGSFYIWSTAKLKLAIPQGSAVRAVMTTEQARPCYLGGHSNVIRR